MSSQSTDHTKGQMTDPKGLQISCLLDLSPYSEETLHELFRFKPLIR